MAQITHFFLGANSGSGFQNLFSEIMDPETAFDLMILKGGPGEMCIRDRSESEHKRTPARSVTPCRCFWQFSGFF